MFDGQSHLIIVDPEEEAKKEGSKVVKRKLSNK